jgi:hypothetical protein
LRPLRGQYRRRPDYLSCLSGTLTLSKSWFKVTKAALFKKFKGEFFNSVDFCETQGCIDHRLIRDDMLKAHLPHHDLMKVRRVVHLREFGTTYRNAKEALKNARTIFKSSSSSTDPDTDSESEADTEDEDGHAPASAKRLSRIPALAISIPQQATPAALSSAHPATAVSTSMQVPNPISKPPPCCGCSKPVTQPCWYCVQCAGESFICWDCDAKGTVSFGTHLHSHDLVRVQDPVEEKDLTMEERFTELEERFSSHEKLMGERLGRLEAVVEGRMTTIEKMLEQVLRRMT